jgi:hypothetical protein
VANVFSGNNCQNTSEPFPYFITGLAKQNVIESITVYPNPANNILFVNGLKGMAVLRITDLLGKQLFIKETNIDNIQLDVSALLPGMYLVQIQTEAGFAVEKIHIQR